MAVYEFDRAKEMKKLKAITDHLPKNQRELCAESVKTAVFMADQLNILMNHIQEHGWSEEYKNGENQYGKKISVEADTFVKLQKSYTATIRMLSERVKEAGGDADTRAGENLAKFVAMGKPVGTK